MTYQGFSLKTSYPSYLSYGIRIQIPELAKFWNLGAIENIEHFFELYIV